MIVVGKCLWKS